MIKKDYICKTCHLHTSQTVHPLANGRYRLKCNECGNVSPVFDKDGNEIPEKRIKEERKNWNG